MPLIAKCDSCGNIVSRNVAKDPVTAVRGKLTIKISVVKSNGSDPIICTRCAQLAAYHGEIHGASEAAA